MGMGNRAGKDIYPFMSRVVHHPRDTPLDNKGAPLRYRLGYSQSASVETFPYEGMKINATRFPIKGFLLSRERVERVERGSTWDTHIHVSYVLTMWASGAISQEVVEGMCSRATEIVGQVPTVEVVENPPDHSFYTEWGEYDPYRWFKLFF